MNDQSSENFDTIINLYRRCAQTYSNIVQENDLNLLLQRLFNQLDDKQSGYLLREHLLNILQTFYNSLNDNDKQNVNQPTQCKKSIFSFNKISSSSSQGLLLNKQ